MAKSKPTTKPKAQQGSTPSELDARRDYNAKRFLDMESNIYDIGDMADANDHVCQDFIQELRSMAELNITGAELAEHLRQWENRASFMAHQTKLMAQRLRSHYEAQP